MKSFKYQLFLLVSITFSIKPVAQITEGDILSDSLVRAGYVNLGRAGFDTNSANGFYIQDKRKPTFRLNFGAWTTPRYNNILLNNTPDSIPSSVKGYAINRTRLYFTGKYSDQFNFTLVTNISGEGDFSLQQAYLTYTINEDYIISVGKQFVASSREDWMDPSNILSMQCSANDDAFALGSSFGALLYRRPKNHMRWWISLSNGLYGWNRAVTGADQSDFMVGGRYEYALKGNNWRVWDDLVGRKGRAKDVLFGAAANFMQQTIETYKDRAFQLNLDATFNGDGYQVLIAGAWTAQFPNQIGNFNQYGFYAQGGYFFTNTVQLYVRYDLVHPGNTPGNWDVFSAPGLGLNVYPFRFTNRWKLTLEYNSLFSTMNNTIVTSHSGLGYADSDYYGQQSFRFQIQFGF